MKVAVKYVTAVNDDSGRAISMVKEETFEDIKDYRGWNMFLILIKTNRDQIILPSGHIQKIEIESSRVTLPGQKEPSMN